MSSNCGRQSAADMREQQKKNLAQATAVQPTVAVMEHNWQALIASLKMVTEIEAQILLLLADCFRKFLAHFARARFDRLRCGLHQLLRILRFCRNQLLIILHRLDSGLLVLLQHLDLLAHQGNQFLCRCQ